MKLKQFDENKLPMCQWKDCNNPANALVNSPGKGYIPLCWEHYKIVRLKAKEIELNLK